MTQDVSLSGIILDAYATAQTTIPKNMKRYNERFSAGRESVLSIIRAGATANVSVYGVDLANPWKGNNAPAGALPAGSAQSLTWVGKGDGATQVFDATNIPYVAISNLSYQLDLHQFDRFPYCASQSGIYAGFTVAADGAGTGTSLTFPTESFNGDGSTLAFTTKTPAEFYFGPGVTFPPSTPAAANAYLTPSVYVGGVLQAPSTYGWTASAPATTTPTGSVAVLTFTAGNAPALGTGNLTVQWAPTLGMEFGLSYVAPVTIWAASTQQFKRIITRSYDRIWAVLASGPSATSIYVDGFGKG